MIGEIISWSLLNTLNNLWSSYNYTIYHFIPGPHHEHCVANSFVETFFNLLFLFFKIGYHRIALIGLELT